jgi:cytochrome P450
LAAPALERFSARAPIDLGSADFAAHKYDWYRWLLEEAPVCRGKIGLIMPLLAAANHDTRAFENPDDFDVARSPNHHLGFGFGMHFCLGKQLALMEMRVALQNLFERGPLLKLAVDPSDLEIVSLPGWHRHAQLPVTLG